MRILVTGGSGQVGFELQRSLTLYGEVVAPNRMELDLSDEQAVINYLQQLKPDMIVNAAAWTAVDLAESSFDDAYQLNHRLPKILAEYSARYGSWLIHYSSDYVYPGDGEQPWSESDTAGPLSVYGASKLAGDESVIESGADALIFRTSWVYGARGNNFMKTMLRLGAERTALNVVADQWGAPTPARLIADVTALAIDRIVQKRPIAAGIYHLAPQGETNWCEFAKLIFSESIKREQPLAIQPNAVHAITTADYPVPAARPKNSRLSLSKLEAALNVKMPAWQAQLLLTLDEYLSMKGTV